MEHVIFESTDLSLFLESDFGEKTDPFEYPERLVRKMNKGLSTIPKKKGK